MQFKLLVVKVLLNFMVSFQGKLHAMYYLIDCFLLLNIHLFPPPVFSLISRDDNDFSGRKGERLTGLTRDLPEEQACRREVAAKTDSFSGTPLCNIFTVGVWDSTRTPFLLNAGSQASETWHFFKTQSPPYQAKSNWGGFHTVHWCCERSKSNLFIPPGHASPWTDMLTGGKQVLLIWEILPQMQIPSSQEQISLKVDWRIRLRVRPPAACSSCYTRMCITKLISTDIS